MDHHAAAMFHGCAPMPSQRRARLIFPGLLGPVSDPNTVARIAQPLPALSRYLTRARRRDDAIADGEGATCAAFGVKGPPWPVASAARHGEAAPPAHGEAGSWLRLDPVHLRVDANHARLFGPYVLDVTADEADALVGRLNEHLAADALQLEAPAPQRWYLPLAASPDLRTTPLPFVAGRNVNMFLPSGGDAGRWRGWLTELQMLLHDAPTNTARERAGRLPVNSVWAWGEGPAPRASAAPEAVLADEPLPRGLAALAGAQAFDLPTQAPTDWLEGSTLVVDSSAREPLIHGEIEGWLEALSRIDAQWLEPVWAALVEGRLDAVELEAGDGRCFEATRAARYRFWRRERPWHTWLARE
jgi:hypothetical protein